MKKPLISVILPVYNVENYIEECLNSLIKQTIGFQNLEVILVNDCSTDGTPEILDQYKDKYNNLIVIHLKENCGAPGEPRNIGIKKASGEYLIFLDPDDYIPLDAYEKLYKVAVEKKSDFVMGKMLSFDEKDGRTYEHITFKNYLLHKNYYNVNIKTAPFFLQVKTAVYLKLVKTDFVRKNNITFIEGMRNGEDKIYDVQLFKKAESFSYIPEIIYYYRARNDEKNLSLTQQDIISTVRNDVKSAQLIKPMLDAEEYSYFQINALRSILWKVGDPDFKKLSLIDKLDLLRLIAPVAENFNLTLAKKYFALESPFLMLLSKGYLIEALDFLQMLISRRWWYFKGMDLQKKYNRQQEIKESLSWKITKIFRNRNISLKYKIKERYLGEGTHNNNSYI
ncbi:hypothetical protein BSBH6_04245 [Bacillus subtilis]|nr:hypothetical protein BSBH6_04245 [Bacillus subtilis]RPK19893.1 hypothetical protein BH5_04246 [Bacillus subtilis]